MHDAHAASTTAAGRLDDDRIADCTRHLNDFFGHVRERPLTTGHTRNTRFFHGRLGAYLVAHEHNSLGAWADKHESALLDTLGKIGVLRQEPVAGMYRLGVRNFS